MDLMARTEMQPRAASALRSWTAVTAIAILLLLWSAPELLAGGRVTDPSGAARIAPTWPWHLGLSIYFFALAGSVRRALWLLVPVALLSPLESFYAWHFGLPSGAHVYGVIADTDRAEALSWFGPWLWPALAALLLIWAAVAWAARRCWRVDWRWRHRSRVWVVAGGTLLVAGQAWLTVLNDGLNQRLDADEQYKYVQHKLTATQTGPRAQFEAVFPWGLPLRWLRFHEHGWRLAEHHLRVARHDFGVRWRPGLATGERQVHVLVIGETGRPDRWGLFGAARPTTPRLSARTDLLPFTDAVSAAAATRESVSLMLTRRPPADMLAPTDEPSLITAFRQAGFRTYWLSTQGTAGSHETPISVLAHEADETHFINPADYRGASVYDGELLPLLQRVLAKNEPRQLIVLHTLGSHLHYAHRYPPAFERFKPALAPSEKPDIWRPGQVELLRNAYDNSVLYTDEVLASALAQLERQAPLATLTYLADHGDVLFDGNCGRGGHGFAAAVNYRVPMFMWLSPRWRAQRPDALAHLQAQRTRPISALALFPTLTGLAGFDIAAPHAHADLGAAARPAAPRMVTHFGDFDRVVAGRMCDSQPAGSP